jgi:hypothetical protein
MPDDPRLEGGEELDAWVFAAGQVLSFASPLVTSLEDDPGAYAMVNVAFHGFHIPFVDAAAARVFQDVCGSDIQLLPITLAGDPGWFVMNILPQRWCLDESRSQFAHETDPERLARGKRYEIVYTFRVRADAVADTRILWSLDWPIIICDERVRNAVEQAQLTGIKFADVT